MMRIWGVLIIVLTGCGGGGGGGSDGSGSGIDPRLSRLDIYEAQKIRVLGEPGAGVMGLALTDDATVAMTTGAVTFEGSITLRVETDPATAVLAGDATMTMDFDSGDVGGALENVFGTNPDGVLRDYDGSLAITGGDIGADNSWAADYSGTLRSTDENLVIDGSLTGDFYGNSVVAVAGADLATEVFYNGVRTDAVTTLIAEAAE